MDSKVIFHKEYDAESLCDVERDVIESFDERFNAAMIPVPQDPETGFCEGTFIVTIEWKPE